MERRCMNPACTEDRAPDNSYCVYCRDQIAASTRDDTYWYSVDTCEYRCNDCVSYSMRLDTRSQIGERYVWQPYGFYIRGSVETTETLVPCDACGKPLQTHALDGSDHDAAMARWSLCNTLRARNLPSDTALRLWHNAHYRARDIPRWANVLREQAIRAIRDGSPDWLLQDVLIDYETILRSNARYILHFQYQSGTACAPLTGQGAGKDQSNAYSLMYWARAHALEDSARMLLIDMVAGSVDRVQSSPQCALDFLASDPDSVPSVLADFYVT